MDQIRRCATVHDNLVVLDLREEEGKSIIDRSSKTDVGSLVLEYGGGGGQAAGTCQIENGDAARVREELIAKITADG